MVTKCPLRMRMRRADTDSIKIGIKSDKMEEVDGGGVSERIKVLSEEIMAALKLKSPREAAFGLARDIIHMEIAGPHFSNLTLVDLPGLYEGDSDGNKIEGVYEYIRSIYSMYISNPACIIVCVLTATEDNARQMARGIATEVDPTSARTVFALTKVDMISPRVVIDRLVGRGPNALPASGLGSVALMNCVEVEGGGGGVLPSAPRFEDIDHAEREFFSAKAFEELRAENWGLDELVRKLSAMQLTRCSEAIPTLKRQIEEELHRKKCTLDALPEAIATPHQAILQLSKEVDLFSRNIDRAYKTDTAELDERLAALPKPPAFLSAVHFVPRMVALIEHFSGQVDACKSKIFHAGFFGVIKAKHKEKLGTSLDDLTIAYVFPELVSAEVQRLREPSLKLLGEVHDMMRAALIALAEISFSSMRLRSAAISVISDLLRVTKDECELRIVELLLSEQTSPGFTCNHYYSATLLKINTPRRVAFLLKAIHGPPASAGASAADESDGAGGKDDDSLVERARDEALLSSSTSGEGALALHAAAAAVPSVPHAIAASAAGHVGTSQANNADVAAMELMMKLYSYRKVVHKRYIDAVGLLLRTKFALRLRAEATNVLLAHLVVSSDGAHPAAAAPSGARSPAPLTAVAIPLVPAVKRSGQLITPILGMAVNKNVFELLQPPLQARSERARLEKSISSLSEALESIGAAGF